MIHSVEISSVNLVLFRPIRSRPLSNLSTNQDLTNHSTNQTLSQQQLNLDRLQLRTVLSALKFHGVMIHLQRILLQLLPHKQAVIHGQQATAKQLRLGLNQMQRQHQLVILGLLLAMIKQLIHFKQLLIPSG